MANILVVDDELSMRQFLTHLFQRDGHSIRVAENGRQAMTLLRQEPADVIISDVKMPDMGGIDLLRAARELQPTVEAINRMKMRGRARPTSTPRGKLFCSALLISFRSLSTTIF